MTTLVLALVALGASGPRFIEDDFERALAQAKKEKKLLFVEAWAPWCHSCVFMRQHVLTRPAFVAYEKEVVFAAVDTEKAVNAPFLEAHPVEVLPSLFFIEPSEGKVLLKWLGSTDEVQMRALLDAARGGKGIVAEADGLLASGHASEAAQRYLAGLQGGPADAPGRAVLSMLSALTLAHAYEACAKTAADTLETLTNASERVSALTWGLGCALELPASEAREAMLERLARPARAFLEAPAAEGVLADDVSGLYEVVVSERGAAGRADEAEATARAWLAYLEAQAARAASPQARAAFDPHRVAASLAAHLPERALPPLQQSERELPKDYNPPARLALVLRALDRLDEALAASRRALAKCAGGPRKLRLYETELSILERQGKTEERARELKAMVAFARRLPRAQLSAERLAALEQRLAP